MPTKKVFCMSKNPKAVGESSEAQILATMVKAGKTVLLPWGDNQRYDLVVDEDGKFIRIQCKTACLSRDGSYIRFRTCSMNCLTWSRRSYDGGADLFAVYCEGTGEVYIVPVRGAPLGSYNLRITEAKNGQKIGIKRASDFVFDGSKNLDSCLK